MTFVQVLKNRGERRARAVFVLQNFLGGPNDNRVNACKTHVHGAMMWAFLQDDDWLVSDSCRARQDKNASRGIGQRLRGSDSIKSSLTSRMCLTPPNTVP